MYKKTVSRFPKHFCNYFFHKNAFQPFQFFPNVYFIYAAYHVRYLSEREAESNRHDVGCVVGGPGSRLVA